MAALNICNLMLHKDGNKIVKLVKSQIPNIHCIGICILHIYPMPHDGPQKGPEHIKHC
jgi:hypothetical protein